MRTNLKMMAAVVTMGMMIASCGNENLAESGLPADFGTQIGSAYFGTGMYYTYIPNGTVTRAGMKTKYCILPIRSELRTQDNSSLHITINDEWEE
jgi:hypothetical protein